VILIKEVIGNEVSEKIHLLNSYLPFSANAIDSLEKYVNRTKFLMDKEQKLIIVIFESNYNKHIWNSPIVWVFGCLECINNIFESLLREYPERFIILACGNNFKPPKYENIRLYVEDLMILKELKISPKRNPLKLDERYALDSLTLSTDNKKEIDQSELERERNFLKERETYGFFMEGKLISRGSIMSNASGYSGIGGFITHPDFRNKGYGTDLVSYISSIVIKRENIPFLTVRSDNKIAISLYSKIGFVKIGNVIFMDYKTGSIP